MSSWIKNTLLLFAALIIFLIVWEIVVRTAGIPPYTLPSPTRIVYSAYVNCEQLLLAVGITWIESAVGLAIAATVAGALSLVSEISAKVRAVLVPSLVATKSIPLIAIAPILTIWLGFGIQAKAVTSALLSIFPIVITTLAAFDSIPESRRLLLKSLNATKWESLKKLSIPSSVIGFLDGTLIAAPLSVVGAIVSEMTGSTTGIGYELLTATNRLDTPFLFACVFSSCIIGWSLFLFVFLTRFLIIRCFSINPNEL